MTGPLPVLHKPFHIKCLSTVYERELTTMKLQLIVAEVTVPTVGGGTMPPAAARASPAPAKNLG
jgi:hypothetical protein